MRAHVLSVLVLLLAATGCGDSAPDATETGGPGGPAGGKADGTGTPAAYEVLLTDPHCDVCTADDKAWLQKRSAVVARVVALIDGAEASVDVAQFTFSVAAIEAALKRAHERGVAVRLAMNAAQAQGSNPTTRLAAAGVPVRFVKGSGNGPNPGLQHAKFMVVDGATLLTGSNNWSSTGTTINEENVTVARDATLVKAFACHFDAMWAQKPDRASACGVNGLVAFTPGTAAVNLLTDGLRGARRSVDVLMHHLLFDKLLKELAKVAERGVRVRIVVNAADRHETGGPLWDRLRRAGVEIRYKQGNADQYQLMHHKLAIIDGAVLLNGSGNWSGSAFFNNWENFVRYTDPTVLAPYNALFARLWTWSLSAEALDAGLTAGRQHAGDTRVYFGNLHAHYHAGEHGEVWDDGKPERLDDEGKAYSVDVGDEHAEAARFAFEYARDRGGMDFLALTPHVVDDREGDGPDVPNMRAEGYAALRKAAEAVTTESRGAFLGLAGMEWSTNSTGNHVNVFGTRELAKVERGRFDLLYDEWLPAQAKAGDRPFLMLNHPRTFREHEALTGNWDQVFGVPLTDITRSGERKQKFNDYGLDDYAPLKDVRASWIDGSALPDEAVVAATLKNIEAASRPYLRLMEVTVGRGTDLGSEHAHNPSISEREGFAERYTKVHDDWDYYLRHGFRLAPAANHDNHFANWGTGHTTRTAVLAPTLSETALLDAIDARAVYATEDEDLEMRFHAADRVPMGGELRTLDDRVTAELFFADPTYDGRFTLRLLRGTIGGDEVEAVFERTDIQAGTWHGLALDLPGPGTHFFYVELHALDSDRMAWSSPIWIERLAP